MIEPGRPITTAAEAGAFLESLINFERDPRFRYERLGLEPITALLAELGDPHRPLSVVHVAGSKGKGSTVLLCEALLGALGEQVGTFTSPHLERWTERFRVGGREVDESALAAAVERVRPVVERMRRDDARSAPTFFDVTTAAAFVLFADRAVDRVLLEVGLGGRLDSTNVVSPAVTALTTVELEHTDKLGDTLAAIAGEKAGILKPGVPCVVGRLPAEALAVVSARAEALRVPLWRLDVDFEVDAGTPGRLAYRDRSGLAVDVPVSVLGRHQVENAGLALACAGLLGAHPPAALARAATAFRDVRLPGRVELVRERPWIVIDGAHTVASARALSEAIAPIPSRHRELVLSVSAGKDLAGILDVLLPGCDRVTLTRAEPHRSLDPQELAAAVRRVAGDREVRVVPNPHLAVRAARAALGPDALLCITGSVYLAGIARAVLRDGPDAPVVVSRRTREPSDAGRRG